MQTPLTIGVKYCGGCNPRFDRSGFVKRLQEDFPQITVTGAQNEGAGRPDFVLVVNGCASACASHEHLVGERGKWIVDSQEDYQTIYDIIKQNL